MGFDNLILDSLAVDARVIYEVEVTRKKALSFRGVLSKLHLFDGIIRLLLRLGDQSRAHTPLCRRVGSALVSKLGGR